MTPELLALLQTFRNMLEASQLLGEGENPPLTLSQARRLLLVFSAVVCEQASSPAGSLSAEEVLPDNEITDAESAALTALYLATKHL
jgi:hypothetical protein